MRISLFVEKKKETLKETSQEAGITNRDQKSKYCEPVVSEKANLTLFTYSYRT